jgi:hypothetical protein
MARSELDRNKAKVRGVLRRLKLVRCDNFRVVGAGNWGAGKAMMPWTQRKQR